MCFTKNDNNKIDYADRTETFTLTPLSTVSWQTNTDFPTPHHTFCFRLSAPPQVCFLGGMGGASHKPTEQEI